jgi:hypothetical protein
VLGVGTSTQNYGSALPCLVARAHSPSSLASPLPSWYDGIEHVSEFHVLPAWGSSIYHDPTSILFLKELYLVDIFLCSIRNSKSLYPHPKCLYVYHIYLGQPNTIHAQHAHNATLQSAKSTRSVRNYTKSAQKHPTRSPRAASRRRRGHRPNRLAHPRCSPPDREASQVGELTRPSGFREGPS